MKITSSIDGKRVEEWSGDTRLPTILTQDELQADYDAYKLKREEAQGYSAPGVNLIGLLFFAMIPAGVWLWFKLIAWAWQAVMGVAG